MRLLAITASILLLAITVLAGARGFDAARDAWRLQSSGVETEGRITLIGGVGGSRLKGRHVFVRFVNEARDIQVQSGSASAAYLADHRLGQIVTLRYWSGDPSVMEVEPGATRRHALFWSGVSLLAFLVLLRVGGYVVRRP